MKQNVFKTIGASLAMLFLFATVAFAAMGDVQDFAFNGFGPTDLVSAGEVDQPDGNPDARFSATISGVGALSGLLLRSEEDGAVWDTTPGNQIWGMRVKDSSGNILTESSGRLSLVPFIMGLHIELSVPDNGAIARGGRFTLTARFIDNSESSATLTVQPSYKTSTSSRLNLRSARWVDKGPRDLTGKNESFRGDGNTDDHIRLELDGNGTLVSVELHNIVDGNPTVAWDTMPHNGRWALAVAQGNRILNRYDGSVEENLSGHTTLDLWMNDNGAIASGNSRFEVVLRFSDGQYLTGFVNNRSGQTWDQSKGLEATFAGEGDRDLVGPNEERSGNGKRDWRVDVNIEPSGTVIGMKITNVKGSSGEWDTLPKNGKWLLAVTKPNGNILNRSSDGSVNFPVTRSTDFILWLENNGSLDRSVTQSILTVIYDDGRVLETKIKPYSVTSHSGDRNFLEASFVGVGNADYVGKNENLRGNQSRDHCFDIRFTAKGEPTAIHLVNLTRDGEWDTIPNNGKWLIAVKQPGGSILNAPNGSIRLSVDGTASLELWVEDNDTLRDKASAFRISIDFSDGSTIKKDIPARNGANQLEVDNNKRELDLSKPRQASSSDYVGPYDRLKKNGTMDWYFNLKIKGKGTIKAMTLKNVGASGEWDTIPGNGRWTLAVRGTGNRILNNSNGSVSFSIPHNHNVYLFVENNGTLHLSKSSYELVVTWTDGTTSTVIVR